MVLQRYGDTAATHRRAKHLRRERRCIITKRPRKDIIVCVLGSMAKCSRSAATIFYAIKYWEPDAYYAWMEAVKKDPQFVSVEFDCCRPPLNGGKRSEAARGSRVVDMKLPSTVRRCQSLRS